VQAGLVERARGGDHAAFTELVALERDRCYSIAYRILRDAERAQDAVQVAYLQAWIKLPGLRDPERFGVWLYRLLVNACYEESRRYRRWSIHVQTLPIEGPDTPDPTITVDERDALDRAFERLTPEHRAVVVLHHYVGLPLATIADVVGTPVGTVKSRLHYALRIVRAAIESADEPEVREVRPA
jgi:RNA polymerase sigma-70 factor (ECF subfamily)